MVRVFNSCDTHAGTRGARTTARARTSTRSSVHGAHLDLGQQEELDANPAYSMYTRPTQSPSDKFDAVVMRTRRTPVQPEARTIALYGPLANDRTRVLRGLDSDCDHCKHRVAIR